MAKIPNSTKTLDSEYWYWFIYVILAAFRLSSAIYIHSGYLFPDEFFQSVEIAAGDVYPGICNLRTWDFRGEEPGPVRSPTALYPFAILPAFLFKHLLPPINMQNVTGDEWITRILFPTRLLTVVVSFLPDMLIVWLNSRSTEQNTKAPRLLSLLMYASMAYGGLVFGSRTLINVWELGLFSIFVFLSTQTGLGYLICQAIISAWAVFLRPPFIIFVTPFVLLQIIQLHRQPYWKSNFLVRIPVGLAVAAAVSAFIIKSDTEYFGKPFGDWVISPLRFARYNSDVKTLTKHGLHPWFHYLFIHWPIMLTPPVTFAAFFPPQLSGGLRFACWSSLVLSTIVHTLIPHKEPRFLLPAVPLALVLGIDNLSICFSNRKRRRLLYTGMVLWIVYQLVLTLFWGFMHQGGLVPLMQTLNANNNSELAQTLTIFHETYMPPRFPFGYPAGGNINSSAHLACLKDFVDESNCPSVIDLAGKSNSDFLKILKCVKSQGFQRIRLIVPGSRAPSRKTLADLGYLQQTQKFFPHVSTENLPSPMLPYCPLDMHVFDCLEVYWTDLKSQLSLHSYIISPSL